MQERTAVEDARGSYADADAQNDRFLTEEQLCELEGVKAESSKRNTVRSGGSSMPSTPAYSTTLPRVTLMA